MSDGNSSAETEEIATVVSALAALKGLTQKDVARIVDVDPATITRRRQGVGQWSASDIRRLAEHFDVSMRVFWQPSSDLWAAITDDRLSDLCSAVAARRAADFVITHDDGTATFIQVRSWPQLAESDQLAELRGILAEASPSDFAYVVDAARNRVEDSPKTAPKRKRKTS